MSAAKIHFLYKKSVKKECTNRVQMNVPPMYKVYKYMVISLYTTSYIPLITLSQSDGVPFFLNALEYILLLEALIASFVKHIILAIFAGFIPIFISIQTLCSCKDTSRKL